MLALYINYLTKFSQLCEETKARRLEQFAQSQIRIQVCMTQALSFPALLPFLPLFPVLFFSLEIAPIQYGAITVNFVKDVELGFSSHGRKLEK